MSALSAQISGKEVHMEIACQNCRFFAATAGPSEGGYCRRYPPMLLSSEQTDEVAPDLRPGVWPMVAPSSWCGEFVSMSGLASSR